MGTITRTQLLVAVFGLSLCGVCAAAGITKLAQVSDPGTIIIDDGDAGYVDGGFMASTPYPIGYNGDTAYLKAGSSGQATWTFQQLGAGTYDVYATWGVDLRMGRNGIPALTKQSIYTISSASNASKDISEDQSVKAISLVVNGRGWAMLGTLTVADGENITVAVRPGAKDGYTIADAAMIQKHAGATVTPVTPVIPVAPVTPTAPAATCGPVACPTIGRPNCSYTPDTTIDPATGCLKNPCGILKCTDPTPTPTPTPTPAPVPTVGSTCGNGTVESGEQCDDGNHKPGDGCSASCQKETCGDGVVTPSLGEECDDGAQNGMQFHGALPTAICSQYTCTWLFCGDGSVNVGNEQCDDGNIVNGDGCNSSCQNEPKIFCGFTPAGGGIQCEQATVTACNAAHGTIFQTNDACFAGQMGSVQVTITSPNVQGNPPADFTNTAIPLSATITFTGTVKEQNVQTSVTTWKFDPTILNCIPAPSNVSGQLFLSCTGIKAGTSNVSLIDNATMSEGTQKSIESNVIGVTVSPDQSGSACKTPATVAGAVWQNVQALDVDNNGTIEKADADAVISYINQITAQSLPNTLSATHTGNLFYNVNGSKNNQGQETVDAYDALAIINYLQCQSTSPAPGTCAADYSCNAQSLNNQCVPLTVNCAPGYTADYAGSCGTVSCVGTCGRCIPATTTVGANLIVGMKSLATNNTVVKNQKNVNLLKFQTLAKNQDVLFTGVILDAAAGSLTNAQNYTLWTDTDGDGVVDTIIEKGVSAQNGVVSMNQILNGGYIMKKDAFGLFEIHADIASSVTDGGLQLKFATTNANYITAETLTTGADLTGISTNNVCPAGTTCALLVNTTPSTIFTITGQANLYVTQSPTPTRSHQLLAGVLSDSVLNLQLRAENEDVDVTDLQITSRGSTASSIDRLELYKDGSTTPFAMATVSGCGSDDVPNVDNGIAVTTFCANMENGQLIVADGSNQDVIVKARLKSDDVGGLSNEPIQLFISSTAAADNTTGKGAVRARGAISNNNLTANNGDSVTSGEIFIGTSSAAPNQEIQGNKNVVVLAKVVSIMGDPSAPADGTAIPTGISSIGYFRFTAAANSNTQNGLNKVSLQRLEFAVAKTNVQIDANSYKLFNRADNSVKANCTVIGGGTTMQTDVVECKALDVSAANFTLSSGDTTSYVLSATITNPNTGTSASSLQVFLQNFSSPTAGPNDNVIQWQDKDAGSTATYNWIESDDTTVKSTLFRD